MQMHKNTRMGSQAGPDQCPSLEGKSVHLEEEFSLFGVLPGIPGI